jgi:hypothetical protein
MYSFKGTVLRDGFGFWWHAWSVIGLNWGRGQFLNFFRYSKDFMCIKSVFLAVNASLRWLNNVSGVYLVQVSLLLIGQQGLGHFFRYRPLLPIGWRIVQILHQRRRKTTNTAPITLSASSKPIHFYQCTIKFLKLTIHVIKIHLVRQSL